MRYSFGEGVCGNEVLSAWCLAWPRFQTGRRLLAIEDVSAWTVKAESKLGGLEQAGEIYSTHRSSKNLEA